MKNAIRTSRRVYCRSVMLLVPYLAILAVTVLLIGRLQSQILYRASYLIESLKLGILGIVYFSFAGYELVSLSRRAGAQECIALIPGAERKLALGQAVVLLAPLLLWAAVLYAGVAVFCLRKGMNYAPYLIHSLAAVFLYCVLPGVVSILLGACLSRCSRPAAYALLVLWVILAGGLPLSILAQVEVGGVSLAAVFDWFALTVPNANWMPDRVYGVSLEACRWVLALFWLLLLLALFLCRERNRRVRIVSGVLAVLALGCGIRFALRTGDNVMYKDDRPDGTLSTNRNYYRSQLPQEEAPAGFSVERYELDFTVHRNFQGTATLKLSPAEGPAYGFTLYHGLKVTSVTNEAGEPLAFQREGDYLDIQSEKPLSEVTVTYGGKTGKYLANYQAVILPGYFAYYPIPGHQAVWDGEAYAMALTETGSEAEYQVTVHSPLTVYSNLPAQSTNRFSGTSDSLTLYAGLLEETDRSGVRYLTSPVSEAEQNLSPEAVQQEWEKLAQALSLDPAVPEKLTTEGKTVIYQAESIGASDFANEQYIYLGDTILVTDLYATPSVLCSQYVCGTIPRNSAKEMLRAKFETCIYDYSPGSYSGTYEKPAYSELEILKKYDSEFDLDWDDEEELMQYVQAKEGTLLELLNYQMQTLGEQTVLTAVYVYLLDEEDTTHPVDFLYQLGGDSNG